MRYSHFAAAAVSLAWAVLAPGAAPAEQYNLPVQKRTRTCVELNAPVVPLRFADGSPTGFFVRGDDPSKLGGSKHCPIGTAEIDAHEVLKTATGMTLYFHPGGGPDHYRDYVENGQYGHIAAEDLKVRPKLVPTLNGQAAPVPAEVVTTYLITPTRIPRDMWYKANVTNGRSGSTYLTYGNPGYDKTRGRGDWTYINWSWMHNGGEQYPQNICRGGGMVRAIATRDIPFIACDVEPIIGLSYGADNQPNGRVTAFYGRTHTGPGDGGGPIHGWLPHSYQKTYGIIVPCVRRAPSPRPTRPTALPQPSDDRMVRMANNLLHEMVADPGTARRWRTLRREQLAQEPQEAGRMELLTQISRLDQPETIDLLLNALKIEQHAQVREQTIALLGYMRSTAQRVQPVLHALLDNYRRSRGKAELLRTLDVLVNVPRAESVRAVLDLRSIIPRQSDAYFATGDALLRLAPRVKVDPALLEEVKRDLEHRRGTTAPPVDVEDSPAD